MRMLSVVQVLGVDGAGLVAVMTNQRARRVAAAVQGERHAVRVLGVSADLESAVAGAARAALPGPAAIGRAALNLGPEAALLFTTEGGAVK